jgi:Sulfotransferase family
VSGLLDAASIIAEGEAITGVADAQPELHANLRALVAALNKDSRHGDEGRASCRQALLRVVKDRLTAQQWLSDFPAIAEEVIREPVFLTGLPRSGTTYFQYLFDHDRRFRLIRTWEAIMPFPPPGHDPASIATRKAMEREVNEDIRSKVKDFDALHLIDEDGPQECHLFLEYGYGAAGFHNMYDVPDYFDFLMDELDMEPVYRLEKQMLQLLQWKCPQPRWALKYPNHVIAMDPILKVFPDARFVMTHRDPVQTLASIAKMTFSLRGTREAAPVDPHRVGAQMRHFIRRHIDRIMAFCTGPDADRVTHVDYYRVAQDPAAVLGEVHAGIGIDTPDDVREAIASWRRENPKGKRGENRYTLEQFGLVEAELRELYADYIAYFNIPSEAEGTARTA